MLTLVVVVAECEWVVPITNIPTDLVERRINLSAWLVPRVLSSASSVKLKCHMNVIWMSYTALFTNLKLTFCEDEYLLSSAPIINNGVLSSINTPTKGHFHGLLKGLLQIMTASKIDAKGSGRASMLLCAWPTTKKTTSPLLKWKMAWRVACRVRLSVTSQTLKADGRTSHSSLDLT